MLANCSSSTTWETATPKSKTVSVQVPSGYGSVATLVCSHSQVEVLKAGSAASWVAASAPRKIGMNLWLTTVSPSDAAPVLVTSPKSSLADLPSAAQNTGR